MYQWVKIKSSYIEIRKNNVAMETKVMLKMEECTSVNDLYKVQLIETAVSRRIFQYLNIHGTKA